MGQSKVTCPPSGIRSTSRWYWMGRVLAEQRRDDGARVPVLRTSTASYGSEKCGHASIKARCAGVSAWVTVALEVPLRPQAAGERRDGAAEHGADERAEQGLEEASHRGPRRRRGEKRRGDLHREGTAAVNGRRDPRSDGWRWNFRKRRASPGTRARGARMPRDESPN